MEVNHHRKSNFVLCWLLFESQLGKYEASISQWMDAGWFFFFFLTWLLDAAQKG